MPGRKKYKSKSQHHSAMLAYSINRRLTSNIRQVSLNKNIHKKVGVVCGGDYVTFRQSHLVGGWTGDNRRRTASSTCNAV
jgi:hypothetical protein